LPLACAAYDRLTPFRLNCRKASAEEAAIAPSAAAVEICLKALLLTSPAAKMSRRIRE
jgi:hypothetical protein